MQILELHLKHFGKFTDKHIYFPEHVQVLYGENEYGKSTIYAFIKAMLFGMERGRGRAAGRDDFSRYEPWENPNYYAGMMRFRCGTRIFRLERSFDRYTKRVSLICENDGEELSVENGDLEMLLGGMTAAVFENTAAIGQLTARPGQGLAVELKNFAANYYETGGGDVQLQKALDILKNKKRQTEQTLKMHREERLKKRNRLEERKRFVEQERRQLEVAYAKAEMTMRKEREQEIEEQSDGSRNDENILRKMSLVLLLTGVVFAAVSGAVWVLGKTVWGVGSAGFAVLAFLCGVMVLRKCGKRVPEEEPTWIKHQWEMERIQEEEKEKQLQIQNLLEEIEETDLESVEEIKQRERRQALELAERRIQETAEELAQDFGKRLNQVASEILCAVTEGKYTQLLVEEDLELAILSEGQRIPVERLSRGTMEQIYFSLRMAALSLLFEEDVPVILDDAFVFYDEKRLKSALKWLREQPRQVIIFSCQTRERNMMQKWKDEV